MKINHNRQFRLNTHSYLILIWMVLLIAFPSLAMAGTPPKMEVTLAASGTAVKKYDRLPEAAKTLPIQANNIHPAINSRCAARIMIVRNALELGGISTDIKLIEMPNRRREKNEVAKGNAVISTHLFSLDEQSKSETEKLFYISTPVTKPGDFFKGVYCLPDNKKILTSQSIEDLKKRGKPLIGLHWHCNHKMLTNLGFTNIKQGPNSETLFRMIKAGRADWIPLGFFNSPDLSITRSGVTLVPVPGIKFSLPASLHFLVSKKHPDGKKIFEALQKGLAIMLKEGTVDKLLKQDRHTCPSTKSWKVLNPNQAPVLITTSDNLSKNNSPARIN